MARTGEPPSGQLGRKSVAFALAAALAGAVVASVVAHTGPTVRPPPQPAAAGDRGACPLALPAGRFAPGTVIRVTRRDVPDVFGSMKNQAGEDAWRGYRVIAVVALASGSEGAPAVSLERYRRLAVERCGKGIADHSWLVFLQFPNAAAPSLVRQVAFYARTPRGWRLWYTDAPDFDDL